MYVLPYTHTKREGIETLSSSSSVRVELVKINQLAPAPFLEQERSMKSQCVGFPSEMPSGPGRRERRRCVTNRVGHVLLLEGKIRVPPAGKCAFLEPHVNTLSQGKIN